MKKFVIFLLATMVLSCETKPETVMNEDHNTLTYANVLGVGIDVLYPVNAPRNVRLIPQEVGDSLVFQLRWVAPQRQRGASPIEGYEWEFGSDTTQGNALNVVQQTSTTAADQRNVAIWAPITCGDSIFFQARVRATGNWTEEAPWGESAELTFFCENLPPGPPSVDLDSIPPDPMEDWPVAAINDRTDTSINIDVLPIEVRGRTIYTINEDLGSTSLEFQAIQEEAILCAFSNRNGKHYLAYKQFSDILIDNIPEVQDGSVEVTEMPGDFECISVVAVVLQQPQLVQQQMQ